MGQEQIREALAFIPADDRDLWLRMGMAIKSDLGESGFGIWDEWSQLASSYNAGDARLVWKSIQAGGKVTLGTLIYEAKNNGWRGINESKFNTSERTKPKNSSDNSQEQNETGVLAKAIWQQSHEASADHPYFLKKKITPVSGIREISSEKIEAILKYKLKAKNILLSGRLLVIPIKVADKLSTLELIDEKGAKTALSGKGTKTNGYWAAQPFPTDDCAHDVTFLIGEGVATVLSAKEATGHHAIAALSSSNLLNVAKFIREKYPKSSLIVLADLVKTTGKANLSAIKAAQAVQGKLAVPDFGGNRSTNDTDFNDMAVSLGIETVKQAIINASENYSVADEQGWPEPLPLLSKIPSDPYPLDELPSVLKEAVIEVQQFTKAPIPLVAASALTALSLACQTYIDVQRAEGLQGPTGLFFLTIADSGERKSTCDTFFMRAIWDYEKGQAEAAKPILKKYNAEYAAWDAKCGGVKKTIRDLSGKGEDTQEQERELIELEHCKPNPPKIPRLIYNDATPEALKKNLVFVWPSAGIVTSEGGTVFGSHAMNKDSVMRSFATYNQGWDGKSVATDRVSTESLEAQEVRLTMGVQIQEVTLREALSRFGDLARGTGFLARVLFSWPDSTQGTRFYSDPPSHWPALGKFNQLITKILNLSAPISAEGVLAPKLLKLAGLAKLAWVDFHDGLESMLCKDGELHDIRDVASKAADNAARLGALFHFLEFAFLHDEINEESFNSASLVISWHLREAQRFFGELALPEDLINMMLIDEWLISHCRKEKTTQIMFSTLLQYGPKRLRKSLLIETALKGLEELHRAKLITCNRSRSIEINPALLINEG